jgi:hypothetical protein
MPSITGNAANKAKQKLDALKREWKNQGGVGDYVPKTGTKEDYDKLVAAVEAATKKNENIAALQSRLETCGQSVVTLARTLGVI